MLVLKTVTITGTGASARCTFLFGVTFTDEKLPPFIIFKGMPNGRVAQVVSQVDSNVVCTVQKNAWMDEPTTPRPSHFKDSLNWPNTNV